MANEFVPVADWFEPVITISRDDIEHRVLSQFQIVDDPNLPMFFRVREAPTYPYINLRKFLAVVQRAITSPPGTGGNQRVKSIHVNPATDGLVIEFFDE